MATKLLATLLLAGATTGCLLGPNYERPPVPAPETWRDTASADVASLANTPWWEIFQDPQLQELIRTALAGNRDLRIAIERVVAARAQYGYVKADLYPKIDVGAQAGVYDLAEKDLAGALDRDDSVELYDVSAQLSWEIDFFGRLRRANEAQRAVMLGTEEAQRATVLTLVADVASAYVALRDADLQLEIARRTLESRRDYVDLAKTRFEGGLTSEVDLRQAEAEYHRTAAIVQELERSVRQIENLLSLLLGRNPGAIERGIGVAGMPAPPVVPAGLPSELLDRRPDIRVAEENLIAANADIGQAKALLFPRIALTGAFGFGSRDLDTLFDSESQSASLVGGLLQPLFNAGKNRRRVEVAESVMRQSLAAYEGTVLQAFREVEDALVAYQKYGEQRQTQHARVEAQRRVLELVELRYRGGVSDYLSVLDAQRSLFSAEIDEASVIGAHQSALIQLYKALGGGWPAAPATAPAEAQTSSAP